jgi:hypothetical protein
MTKYALVSPVDAVDRIATNIDPTVQTKPGWRWLPVEDTPAPDYPGNLESASAERGVSGDKVVTQWTVTRLPIEVQRQAVKDEARRRILGRYPEWRQANMTARGVELTLAKLREWTSDEQKEAAALQAAWDWVKAVRSASDVIEAMEPIPADFRDDKHWPE